MQSKSHDACLLILLGLLLCVGCSRAHTIEFEMRWSANAAEPEHIYLEFADFPNHYVDMTSAELRAYLDSLGTHDVPVVLQVRTHLGCVERLDVMRIGTREDWPFSWAGTGWVNEKHPSPWDERFRCWNPFF